MDGLRAVAIVKNGKATLWSRSRKPITSMDHIVQSLEANFTNVVLDGELYSDKFSNDFESIVSSVRKESASKTSVLIEYHIFDVVNKDPFEDRVLQMKSFPTIPYIKIVDQVLVNSGEEAMEALANHLKKGYEGTMIKSSDSPYEQKRSYHLQKIKTMKDDEFSIVGVQEGRGKLQGHVGSFICVTQDGAEFLVKMSGSTDKLKEYFQDHSLWKDRFLTVQYQSLTGKNNVPRFPVGLRIRELE
jgi:DNA ligase-1